MRRFVSVVAILAVLLVLLDRGLESLAARGLASYLQSAEHLDQRPGVRFAGFPFVTQAVSGRYERVDVHLRHYRTASGISLDNLDIRLSGVRAPLSQALGAQVHEVSMDQAEASGQIRFATIEQTIEARLPGTGNNVAVRADGADGVKLEGTFNSPAGPVSLAGRITFGVVKGRLVLTVVPESLTGVPSAVRADVAGLVQSAVTAPPLPMGLVVESASVDADRLTLRASGRGITIKQLPAT